MNGNDTLFVMFTSGTTGGPKGLEHTQAGYLLYAMVTYQVERTGDMILEVCLMSVIAPYFLDVVGGF